MLLNMSRGEAYENYLSRQVYMRPEQQATIPVKPHMHLAIEASNNLNILEVVIMMRMTCANLCNFMKKLT